MEKIIIDFLYKKDNYAVSKARKDVNRIAKEHGFTHLLINTFTINERAKIHPSHIYKFFYRIRKIIVIINAICQIKRSSVVLLQYPFYLFTGFYLRVFCRSMRIKNCHFVLLVHDISHFRIHEVFDQTEIKVLNSASELIVHTPQMVDLLRKNGIITPCRLLWLFDYLTEEVPDSKYNHNGPTCIAFAGYLEKSLFLKKLTDISLDGIEMHLYGNDPHDYFVFPFWMKYIGRFSPENVTMLTEEWGLTWDGDSIETIQGPLGNYLRYNSSHKISLYIAAGIPVIVSEESSLAGFVKENKLGITVSSLLELDKKIAQLDETEYQLIRDNVTKMSATLRKGERLGTILDDIVRDVEGIQP
jgi:hypothetical protein